MLLKDYYTLGYLLKMARLEAENEGRHRRGDER
jgi:hypothetical protein